MKSYTAKCLANKYFTYIKTHQGELASDLYLAMRRVAISCDDYENAFDWYGPAVFSQTTEEYFQTNIKKNDKVGTSIQGLIVQRNFRAETKVARRCYKHPGPWPKTV